MLFSSFPYEVVYCGRKVSIRRKACVHFVNYGSWNVFKQYRK